MGNDGRPARSGGLGDRTAATRACCRGCTDPALAFGSGTGWRVLRELAGAVALKFTLPDGSAQPLGQPLIGRRPADGWEIPLGSPATARNLIEIIR